MFVCVSIWVFSAGARTYFVSQGRKTTSEEKENKEQFKTLAKLTLLFCLQRKEKEKEDKQLKLGRRKAIWNESTKANALCKTKPAEYVRLPLECVAHLRKVFFYSDKPLSLSCAHTVFRPKPTYRVFLQKTFGGEHQASHFVCVCVCVCDSVFTKVRSKSCHHIHRKKKKHQYTTHTQKKKRPAQRATSYCKECHSLSEALVFNST